MVSLKIGSLIFPHRWHNMLFDLVTMALSSTDHDECSACHNQWILDVCRRSESNMDLIKTDHELWHHGDSERG